jgi:histidinol-phosphate aminotransferase
VGYALCGAESFVKAVHAVRQPFVVNGVAAAAAIEALRHTDSVTERVERTVMARVELDEGLRALGLTAAESQANFCWFDLPDAAAEDAVVDGLRERGVLVRAGRALGREGALRVTYGTPEQNARFLAALRDLV